MAPLLDLIRTGISPDVRQKNEVAGNPIKRDIGVVVATWTEVLIRSLELRDSPLYLIENEKRFTSPACFYLNWLNHMYCAIVTSP